MSEVKKRAYSMLKSAFLNDDDISHSKVIEMAKKIAGFFSPKGILSEKEINEIVEDYETNIGITAYCPESIISKDENSNWLIEKKNQPNREHLYWERYEDYLKDKDFDESTIQILKKSTEEILGYCANPTPKVNEVKKRKGLVVGDVQSGKTANYMALINMACDYDYKLIIILAGLTDSLRRQTQERVDEGFIGAVSNTIGSYDIKYIGVGNLKKERFAVTLTNLDNDFKKESMNALNNTSADYNKPVVLVVKKNKSTLENVKSWLKPGANGVTDHILIIDDEADNASINTKKFDEDPSSINALIRDLYNNFPKASYVGYTATPYANIFVNPDDEDSYKDLFPSDFITLLKAPSSYFGAYKVFGKNIDGNTKYIRKIDENEKFFLKVDHKKDDQLLCLCDSLKESILCFFLNNVIRTKRGKTYAHRSMMINISRFNKMQSKIKEKVMDYVDLLRKTITQSSYMHKDKFLKNKEMLKMYNLYMTDKYYDSLREEFSWEEIQTSLSYEAERMKVIVVNRLKDEEKLDYKECEDSGARYIVIGGFVLSRGLTLEGLMVSYYSRKGSAYDSLLQMCRWFGYRIKYEDLCRIYMSQINIDNFGEVIDATNDLKQQFIDMKLSGKTPDDFGLMVKKSPDILDTLLVTSRNKSRFAKDKIFTLNYSCQPIDTSKIYFDPFINEKNLMAIKSELENRLGNLSIIDNRYMYRNVNKEIIISLLKKIDIPIENTKFEKQSICEFLESTDRLNLWDVVFATGSSNNILFSFGGEKIPSVRRSFEVRDEDNFVRIADTNNRLMDPGILNSGLNRDVKEIIKNETNGKTPTAKDYLKHRIFPILVIYPIDLFVDDSDVKVKIKEKLNENLLIGFGIGFPYNGNGISIKYKLNVRKQQEMEKRRSEMEDDDDD